MATFDNKKEKMQCSNCNLYFGRKSQGLTKINQCDHFICLKCIIVFVKGANWKQLRCPTNIGNKKITCNGYVDYNDIKDLIPEKAHEKHYPKSDNEPRPSTSKAACIPRPDPKYNRKDSSSSSSDNYDTADSDFEEFSLVGSLKKVKELNPSPKKEKDGWNQMVYYLNELMKRESLNFYDASAYIDQMRIWTTTKPSHCPICEDENVPPGEGIILKDCFHIFCRECIVQHIEHSSEVCEVPCPSSEGKYSCPSRLKPNELRALTSQKVYEKHYNELSLREAEKNLQNVFHCLTPDCKGFCVFDDEAEGGELFVCPICKAGNCLSCKAIHLETCKEYSRRIKGELKRLKQLQREKEVKDQDALDELNRLEQRNNEKISERKITKYLKEKLLIRCPKCKIPCYKYGGCREVVCGSCKHTFGWNGRDSRRLT